MKQIVFGLVLLAGGVALGPACNGSFEHVGPNKRLTATFKAGYLGAPDKRLPISVISSTRFTLRVEAHRPDGSLDTDFNGFVRASIKPGTVLSVSGPRTDGRNVQLQGGVADDIVVEVIASYGDARVWFEDLGYVPSDPVAKKPQCSNGLDDDGDGTIDYPADDGCAFANDDTETGGSYATGASDVIFFALPRISDIRGYDPNVPGSGNATSLPKEQVKIDTGWRGGGNFAFSTVVTRIAPDGFYVTDIQDDLTPKPGFSSVFAFTFSSPPKMRICDRVKLLSGTTSDFFGFTEVGFPTWLIEEWDPALRPCLVPTPRVLSAADLGNTNELFKNESALVQLLNSATTQLHIVKHFGPNDVPKKHDDQQNIDVFVPADDASNCDLNHDGKVDFAHDPESSCSKACDSDVECTEFSDFLGRSNFKIVVIDTAGNVTSKAQVNASASALFDPVLLRGQPIKAFTGTLRYFSGGSQFTIEARCEDDIVTDLKALPIPSDKACVHPRGISDINEGSH